MDDDYDKLVSKACDRIDAATRDFDNETMFDALIAMFTYRMSRVVCDDCRAVIARHLKQSIPDMLANANREAAAHMRDGERALHTHH